jgi:uncharacterized delta-60 repeat protein
MKKIFLLIMLMSTIAFFPQAGTLDTTFNPNDVGFGYGDGTAAGDINTSILLPDEKILIFGNFKSYNAQPASGIARVNPDGTFDPTFNIGGTGVGTGVITTAVRQPDGKIIITGNFTVYNGVSRSCIARINEDGSLDTSFVVGTGFGTFNQTVYSVALQADGKIILGGGFLTYNAIPQKYLTRLNPDGSLDTSFNPSGTGLGPNGYIYQLAIQPNGQIIILGQITTYSFNYVNKIGRLNSDGSVDTTFMAPTTVQVFDSEFGPMVIQPDGKILYKHTYSSDSYSLKRLNADGTEDTSFISYGDVKDIELLPDGKMYVLKGYNGSQITGIQRLNADGSIDTTFGFTNNSVINLEANSMHVLSDNKFILAGNFIGYGYAPGDYITASTVIRPGLLRLNSDRTIDNSFNTGTGFSSPVLAMAVQSDDKVLIGGDFYNYNGASKRRMIRINSDGSDDSTFQQGNPWYVMYPSARDVNAIKIQSDGKIFVAGDFENYQGQTAMKLAKLNSDGTRDTSFASGASIFTEHFALAIQPDGKVLMAGKIAAYGSFSPSGIVRANTNGQFDLVFNTDGMGGTAIDGWPKAHALELLPDGKILVAGDFTLFDNISRNRFARLNSNGTLDTTFNVGTGADGIVYTILLQPDGKILLGGDFTTYNGTPCGRIVRLNADGSIDFTFNAVANDDVRTMVLQPTGKILIGGKFTNYNSSGTSYLVRLNPDGSHDNTFNAGNSGPNGQVNVIVLLSNSQPIIGGEFTAYNGVGRNRIAKLQYEVLSVNESNFSNQLTVYPNPARTLLNITTEATEAFVKISDLTGKTIIQQQLTPNIDIENLASGVYIIEVSTVDKKQRQKFIKQ